jgi:hypothetical protein
MHLRPFAGRQLGVVVDAFFEHILKIVPVPVPVLVLISRPFLVEITGPVPIDLTLAEVLFLRLDACTQRQQTENRRQQNQTLKSKGTPHDAFSFSVVRQDGAWALRSVQRPR